MRSSVFPLAVMLIVGGALLAGRVSTAAGQSAGGTRAPQVPTAQVAWLLFADDLHLDFVRTGSLRGILRTAASALRDGNSAIGLRASGPSMVSHSPSTDPAGLDAAIRRFTGNGLRASDFLIGTPAPSATRELRYRAHVTLSALHTAIGDMASTPAAHKHIVFVSNGFTVLQPAGALSLARPGGDPPLRTIDDPDILAEIAAVARAGVDGGVTISALDPRLFIPGAPDPPGIDGAVWQSYVDASHRTLREMATSTGGTLLDGAQPLADLLLALRARAQR
jgi:hypothetical protein